MPGPKPRPTALKVLRGTQECRINDAEPKPKAGRPIAPTYLDDEARAEWARIVPQLEAMRVLTQADGAGIGVYCQIHSRYVKALRAAETGLTIATGTGSSKPNPAIAIAERCEGLLHKWLSEFGLTPSARSRIKVETRKESELSAFLKQRPQRSG